MLLGLRFELLWLIVLLFYIVVGVVCLLLFLELFVFDPFLKRFIYFLFQICLYLQNVK